MTGPTIQRLGHPEGCPNCRHYSYLIDDQTPGGPTRQLVPCCSDGHAMINTALASVLRSTPTLDKDTP